MTEPTGGAPVPPPSGENVTPQPPPAQQPPSTQGQPPQPPPAQQPLQQPPIAAGPAPGVIYADALTRVIAYIVDMFVYLLFAFVVGLVIGIGYAAGGLIELIALLVGIVLGVIGSAIYFVYFWTHMRASPGQRMLGLETVNAADGATLTQPQAIRRWAFLFGPTAVGSLLGYAPGPLGALGPLVGLLAFFYVVYLLYTITQNPKKQGFHDIQAATVVIKRIA